MKRDNKLIPATGIYFSRLKDNWEECDFRFDVSTDPDDWYDAVYRRYGDLPDGRHFGVYIWPKSEAWPPQSVMMIVSSSGNIMYYPFSCYIMDYLIHNNCSASIASCTFEKVKQFWQSH